MSKMRNLLAGTSCTEELLEIALDAPDQIRPSALDHIALWTLKHPITLSAAVSLARLSKSLDGKMRRFRHV